MRLMVEQLESRDCPSSLPFWDVQPGPIVPGDIQPDLGAIVDTLPAPSLVVDDPIFPWQAAPTPELQALCKAAYEQSLLEQPVAAAAVKPALHAVPHPAAHPITHPVAKVAAAPAIAHHVAPAIHFGLAAHRR